MKKICLTGGGTAGHIMPNIAIFEESHNNFDFFYIGAKNSMEEKLISPLMPFFSAPMVKFVRSFTLKNLKIPFILLKSISACKKILKKEKPALVFSKGGFVSVPVCIAAFLLKIPVITHESDLSLGLGNKIICKFSKKVCTSFKETATKTKKGVFTGSPIRICFENANKSRAIPLINNYNINKKTIVVIGGSLGSKKLNEAILQAVGSLKNYNIVHIVGKNNKNNNLNKNIDNYTQLEFVNNIADVFDLADIVITRGGSNALFELLHMHKKMIIVPLSKNESRGDQIENAIYFKNNKWAEVVFEEDLTTQNLLNTINKCLETEYIFPTNTNGTKNILKAINNEIK